MPRLSKHVTQLIFLIVVLCGLTIMLGLSSHHQTTAQDATATPFSPIIVQSNPNLGNVQPVPLSEAANRVGALDWQNAGYTGAGFKIGVLDRGFGNLISFEQSVNRPVTLALNGDKAAYSGNPITHGTQVLEIIHAIAPGVELVACEYADINRYIQCIDWMQRYDVDIINHSAGVPALPLDGQGRWAQEVDRALDADILWINSAGNFAQGYYEDVLTDSDLNRLHEFRGFGGQVEALGVAGVEGTTQGVVMLSWGALADRPANTIDIDLQVLDRETGVVIAGSYNPQTGQPGQESLEYLTLDMQRDFAVQIIDSNGDAAGVSFSLFVEFANVPGGQTLSSIIAPGDSGASLTVGALQGFEVAPYSSRGPLETGDLGIDLTAPGEVLLADGTRFLGTSAAAPVVAGTVALIWQANPDLSVTQIRNQILAFTVGGGNVNVGQGRLLLPFPNESVSIALAPTLTPTPFPSETPLPSATPTATATTPPTATPTATNTPPATATPTATSTPEPSNTPITTATSTPTDTPTPTNTPAVGTPVALVIDEDLSDTESIRIRGTGIVVSPANLRSGPGTQFDVVGGLPEGEEVEIVSTSDDGVWYEIRRSDGSIAWIAEFLLDPVESGVSLFSLYDLLSEEDQYSEFRTLVDASDLIDLLTIGFPFTVFAPTDDAFATLGLTAEEVLEQPDLVATILRYHIIDIELTEIGDNQQVTTLQGENIRFSVNRSGTQNEFLVNGSVNMASSGRRVGNGILYEVDSVLVPEEALDRLEIIQIQEGTISGVVRDTEGFGILQAALQMTDNIELLEVGFPFTVFAPTDDAFAALFDELGLSIEQALAQPELLNTILRYHILEAQFSSTELLLNTDIEYQTIQGESLSFTGIGGTLVVNDSATVVRSDVEAVNGIVHVIDGVLIPQAAIDALTELGLTIGG